jgi:formate dehydrogenase assembly factor FdhD
MTDLPGQAAEALAGEPGAPSPATGVSATGAAGAAGAAVREMVTAYAAGRVERRPDLVAAEEPLEMRVTAEEGGHRVRHGVAVTMRTPGHDFELTAGFFLSEGIVASREAIWSIAYCQEADEPNVVEVHLKPGVPFDPLRFSRNVYTARAAGSAARPRSTWCAPSARRRRWAASASRRKC